MWKPKDETTRFEPLTGIGGEWRDLSDEEFAALDAALGPGLERWYEHVDDEAKTKKKAASKPAESEV